MNNERKILVPKYISEFACIGAACEDTCCSGWQVSIDKKTYKKYKNVKDKKLNTLIDDSVTRVRTGATDNDYARIKMDEQGMCPMLDGGLCSIQKNLGASYLSNVCSVYPKVTNVVSSVYEKSGTISCPEMARLVLFRPEGIEFDEKTEPKSVQNLFNTQFEPSLPKYENSINKYFWELRIFTITVLQTRMYGIDERMIILGMFYRKLQELVDNQKLDEVPLFIATQLQLVESGKMKKFLQDIPTSNELQLKIVKEVIHFRLTSGKNSQRYLESFQEMLEGINYFDKSSDEENAVGYKHAFDNYFKTTFDKKEYILENYLVNYVFKNMFPKTNFDTMFDEYVLMAIVYATLKMHLIGAAGYHKENYDNEKIARTFQVFSREVEHNPLFLSKIHELFSTAEMNKMSYMTVLLKN